MNGTGSKAVQGAPLMIGIMFDPCRTHFRMNPLRHCIFGKKRGYHLE